MEVQYLTEKQVSEITSIPIPTLRNDRHRKRGLPYSKFGNTVRYSIKDIVEFMDKHRIKTEDRPRKDV